MIFTKNKLPVMEAFYTLQGEGFHAGKAAYFIRLGGCDVGCVWCDVKESWDASLHQQFSVIELIEDAKKYPGRLAVITGGEPLIYNLDDLTKALRNAGFQTNIETSGVHPMSGEWDWVCFSPKKFKEAHPSIFEKANELKVVIYHPSDFIFAEKYAKLVNKNCQLLLQPEWSRKDIMQALIVSFIKENPRWRMSLQTHKYLEIP